MGAGSALPAWLIPESHKLLLCQVSPALSLFVPKGVCGGWINFPQIKPSRAAALPHVPCRPTEGEAIAAFILLPRETVAAPSHPWNCSRNSLGWWRGDAVRRSLNPCQPKPDGCRKGGTTTATKGQAKLPRVWQCQRSSLSSALQLSAEFPHIPVPMAGMTFARHDSCCQFLPGAGCRSLFWDAYLPTRRMEMQGKHSSAKRQRLEQLGLPGSQEPKERSGPGQVGFLLQVEQPADRSVFLQPEDAGSVNADQINAVRAPSLQNKLMPWFPWWRVRVNPPVVQAALILLFQRRKPGQRCRF